jgi:hypothetical protein
MSRIEPVIRRIATARDYTNNLLDHVPVEDWFRQPSEGVTHIAWLVGHDAVAQYALCLKRMRGERPEDEQLIPGSFRALFGKGSTPVPDAACYPSPQQIRGVFDRVHQQALSELREISEGMLDELTEPAHPLFATKEGALEWCACHELIHAGQIALLRRLFGAEPLR